MFARAMAVTHPNVERGVQGSLIHCVEECFDAAQTCCACADACLAEDSVRDLAPCIRACLDCADLCGAAGRIATRRSGSNRTVIGAVLQACAEACARCAEACQRHASRIEACRICAARCGHCEEACLEAMAELEDNASGLAFARH